MRPLRLAAAIAAALACVSVQAQIRTDGSVGAAQTLGGPNYLVPQALGRLAGNNLFHSFSVFNINTGETATFTTTTAGIANVISRVTGGSASLINGQLALRPVSGAPNFYFINPSGVIFGAGASIDVPGAFHVATADYVAFADGKFYADPKAVSTFSSAPPEAFGFLGSNRGLIQVSDGANLAARTMQPISLVAGDIQIDHAQVAANGGDVRIVAIGRQSREVALTGAISGGDGSLQIVHGGMVWSRSGPGYDGGNVALGAGTMLIDGSGTRTGVFSDATGGGGAGGNIDVAVTRDLLILNTGSIAAGTYSSRDGGAVNVHAGSIVIQDVNSLYSNPEAPNLRTGIFTDARDGSGNAGTLTVATPGALTILNAGQIGSYTTSAGRGASITVSAGSATIAGGESGFLTGVIGRGNGSGESPRIAVNIAGDLVVSGGAEISSNTLGGGNAGSVAVSAANIRLDGVGSALRTGIFSFASPGSSGSAGSIDIATPGMLSLVGGAQIGSDTFASGNAGTVKIDAGTLYLSGTASPFATSISSDALFGSTGNGGNVEIRVAGSLTVLDSAYISADTLSTGNAGAVRVTAGSLMIDGTGNCDCLTGISSTAFGSGNAGGVTVTVTGDISVLNGGQIASDTWDNGNAGTVRVSGRNITVDRNNSGIFTGISSDTIYGTGRGGDVEVTATGNLHILRGGQISADTYAAGSAGSVRVSAGTLTIDQGRQLLTGISSNAYGGSTGNAGNVEVNVGDKLTLLDGGLITSDTAGAGNGGTVKVRAGELLADAIDGNSFTGISSEALGTATGHAGGVDIAVTGDLTLDHFAAISSSTFASGNAGTVHVTAGNLSVLGGSRVYSATFGTGNAGLVDVSARTITVNGGSDRIYTTISSDAIGTGLAGTSGDAGGVTVTATDRLTLTNAATISSSATSTGNAGAVSVNAGALMVLNGSQIISSTFASGNAGHVRVMAGSVVVDSQGYTAYGTGILSQAEVGSSGHAGDVEVIASGDVSLVNGGVISSSTFASGDAGSVKVAAGSMHIDSQGLSAIGTGIYSVAVPGSGGDAGTIEIAVAGNLSIANGGQISSSTSATGDAGSVKVTAGSIDIDGKGLTTLATGIYSVADKGSSGNAGTVEVVTQGRLSIVDGGEIASSTAATGNAGSVKVDAGSIIVDRQGAAHDTGIFSKAEAGSGGSAGSVNVVAKDDLVLVNGGSISSSTASVGTAGSVDVTAGTLVVDGRHDAGHPSSINATAESGSSGQTGSVVVRATNSVNVINGGELAITNFASVTDPAALVPTLLTVTAPQINVMSGGQITAASYHNVAASDIRVSFGTALTLTNGEITTSAQDGNGGAIRITGDGVIVLRDSQITTSVAGLSGNGGNIEVVANGLVMQTGFIQANTAASNARGGDVAIDVHMLVPSGNSLFVGGETPYAYQPGVFGLNVIQAAAPTGVSGTIDITTPVLDVSGGLSGLTTKLIDTGGLGRSLCQATGGSSLAQTGRGGLAPSARDFVRVDPALRAKTTSAPPPILLTSLGCPL